jgi:uroporphyrinogen-III synthase
MRSRYAGERGVVQGYGETNRELQASLAGEGAEVIEIVTYRWGLPEDSAPLLRLIDALGCDEIDLVAATSASQASNLFAVAQHDASLKQCPGRTLVASIGTVCSAPQAHREGRYRSKTAEARAVY